MICLAYLPQSPLWSHICGHFRFLFVLARGVGGLPHRCPHSLAFPSPSPFGRLPHPSAPLSIAPELIPAYPNVRPARTSLNAGVVISGVASLCSLRRISFDIFG